MKDKLLSSFGHLPLFSLTLVVGVLPLAFYYGSTDPFELPKVLILVIFITFFSLLFFILSFTQGSIKVTTSPILLLIALLSLIHILTNFISVDPALSFTGWLKSFSSSTTALLLITLLFTLITSLLKKVSTIKKVLISFQVSCFILSVIGIFSAFNIYLLPTGSFRASFWTPGGTNALLTGLTITLGLICSFGLLFQTFIKNKILYLTYLSIGVVSMFTYLALLNWIPLWILLVAGLGTFLLMVKKFENSTIFLSLVLVMISLAVIVTRLLMFSNLRVPTQVNLPLNTALQITKQTVTHFPLGSGPGTFGHDYRLFKPAQVNTTNLFNINFDTSGYLFLDQINEIGIIGGILYLGVFVITLFLLLKYYLSLKKSDPMKVLVSLLFSLTVIVFLSSFLLPSNTMVFFFVFLLLSLVGALVKIGLPQYCREFKFKMPQTGWLIGLITLSLLIFNFNLVYKIFKSDSLSSQAIKIQSSSPNTSYQLLLGAVRLNKNADFLHRQFALTNLALANSVAQNSTVTQDKKIETVSTLVKQALNEARATTTVNPKDSRNWKLYGTVLMQISSVVGATETDINDKFQKALTLEPNDPEIYLDLGNLAASKKDYKGAQSYYEQGLVLKKDYYPLHIQLAENYLLLIEVSGNKTINFGKARDEFKTAISEMEITNPERAVVEKKLGQVEEALSKSP